MNVQETDIKPHVDGFVAALRKIASDAAAAGVKKRPAILNGAADLAASGRYAAALAEVEDVPKKDSHPLVTASALTAADIFRSAIGLPPRVAPADPATSNGAAVTPAAKDAPTAPQRAKDGAVLFTIRAPQQHLLERLSLCADITPAKPTRPALACVLIECGDEKIHLRASGDHDTIEREVPADCSGPGSVMLDARGLLRRVDALDAGDVEMRVTASDVAIYQDGKKRYTVSVYDPGDAPKPIAVEPQGSEVDPKALANLLARVQPFASTDENSPPAQQSVRLITGDGKIKAMSLTSAAGAIGVMDFAGSIDALVMGADVTQLRKVLSKAPSPVKVAVVGTSICVFGEGISYSTRTIGDTFMPLESILPPRSGHGFTARRDAMVKAVESIAVTDPELGRLRFRPSVASIALRGADKNGQDAEASFSAESNAMSVSFGIDYIAKAIGFVTEDEIEMWVDPGNRAPDGGAGAALICGKGSAESVIVMPVRYDAKDLEA